MWKQSLTFRQFPQVLLQLCPYVPSKQAVKNVIKYVVTLYINLDYKLFEFNKNEYTEYVSIFLCIGNVNKRDPEEIVVS